MTAHPRGTRAGELPARIVSLLGSDRLKQQHATSESVAALWRKAVESARDAELEGISVDGGLRAAYDAGLGGALALLDSGAGVALLLVKPRDLLDYFGSMAGSIGTAFNYYSTWDPDWNIHPVVDASTGYAFDALYYVGNYFAHNSRFIGLGFSSGIPVTQQDVPGSTFISQLNSTSSLSTESSVLQKRVGVSTQVHPVYAFFSLISSRPQDWRRARAIAKHGALTLYFYYREHPDYRLSTYAGYWLEVYWYLYVMDVAWHDFIGALYFDAYGFPRARASDGFIPHSSSAYPNATAQYNLNLPDYHISHTEQKDHSAARTKIGDILQYDFGVQQRSSTYEPPPPETCEPTGNEITCAM